jgi:hypothetical protein
LVFLKEVRGDQLLRWRNARLPAGAGARVMNKGPVWPDVLIKRSVIFRMGDRLR